MKKAATYSSHIPALLHVLGRTTGSVLELGAGYFSTPLLHWYCVPRGRMLVTLDNDEKYFQAVSSFASGTHTIKLVEDWDKIDEAGMMWSVVFIDHGPSERRAVDLMRFADRALYIVVHDTDGRNDKHYHLRDLWKEFKYLSSYTMHRPHTTVVSNFCEIGEIC